MRDVILFDLDGVLVDTEPLKAEAHASVLRRLGGSGDTQLYATVMGFDLDVVRNALVAADGLKDIDTTIYDTEFNRAYMQLLDTGLKTSAGAIALLTNLREHECRIGVVTSNDRLVAQKVLTTASLVGLFDVLVSRDDTRTGKPAPDPYIRAVEIFDVAPDRVAVVEDSEAGVDAAVSAGLFVVAVRHKYNQQRAFTRAAAVMDSLEPPSSVGDLLRGRHRNEWRRRGIE